MPPSDDYQRLSKSGQHTEMKLPRSVDGGTLPAIYPKGFTDLAADGITAVEDNPRAANNPNNNTFAIMCPMASTFVDNGSTQLGVYEIAYNTATQVFDIIKIFYRQNNDWTEERLRNDNVAYYVKSIFAV